MTDAAFSEERSAEVVAASFDGAPERLATVMAALTRHLHAFAKEVSLTEAEWAAGIDFLTATGHMCDDRRQEFVMLSDVLGLSMLVETMNHRADSGATESTVLGPFHMVASPPRELGADISLDRRGEPCLVAGRVTDLDGKPIPGAQVDVWQANGEGFYDVQQPELQPEGNLRGLFTADSEGAYWFRTVVPCAYPVPTDGPVGRMLQATGRHPYRPGHVHLLVSAPGFRPVTTHLFVAGSDYIDSDVVFGVKGSLVRSFDVVDDPASAESYGLTNPYRKAEFEVVLAPGGA